MEILPVLTSLRRHRMTAALLVLEIALTCAIVCNAVFIIGERQERMQRPTGVAESEVLQIQIAGIEQDRDAEAQTLEDLRALQAVPGVKFAANGNQLPLGQSSWNSSVKLSEDQAEASVNASTYMGSEDLVEALGLRILSGRDFTANEYIDFEALTDGEEEPSALPVIITRTMAERLFRGEPALGKPLYAWGNTAHRVVGIVDNLARPNEYQGEGGRELSMIFPVRMAYTEASNYLLRVDPMRRQETLAAAVKALEAANPNRIILKQVTYDEIRAKYYERDRAMSWLLVVVCAALLIVTALGIVGLASFWVQERRRQIGIRRALGATRGQILLYFQTENFLVATLGIALGMMMAYGINLWLMEVYELPRLPASFLPIGALALWIVGQLAVLGPALRAAAVPPAVATRNV